MRFFFKENFKIILFLTGLVFICYTLALGNDFASDDITSIQQNPQIFNFSFVTDHLQGFIRPLWYFLSANLFGLNPIPFRILNILSHLGAVICLFFILKHLKNKRVGLIAASIFAAHPILIESVTWISGGPYSQATFFMLLSFLLYLKSNVFKSFYTWSVVFYLCSLFSHTIAIIYLPILVSYELALGKIKDNYLKLVPFAFGSALLTVLSSFNIAERSQTLQTIHYQGKGLNDPFLVFVIGITSYLYLIFFPINLTIYHSELSLTTASFIVRVAILLALACFAVYAYFKDLFVFFFLTVFLLSLLITLGTATYNLTWIVAERYAYLATVAVVSIISYLIDKYLLRGRFYKLGIILVVVLVVLLATRTIIRNLDWRSADDLWLSAEYTSPSSPTNHNNLGDLYGRRGDLSRAILEFKKAIELKPNYGDAYHNLGNAYAQIGKNELAIQSYESAIKYNPYLWQSYQNIAAVYFKEKNTQKSIEYLMQAQKINPQNPSIYNSLGIVYLSLKEKTLALQMFEAALHYDPKNQMAIQGVSEANKL